MNDQWVPAPPPPPPPPPGDPLPPANSWQPSTPCATSGDNPSYVDGIVITGVPAAISAMPWMVVLNDGGSPPNFSINHYDASGALIDSPMLISGVNGMVTFNDVVQLDAGAYATNLAITTGRLIIPDPTHMTIGSANTGQVLTALDYLGTVGWGTPAILADAPLDGNLYGRTNAQWASGGTFVRPVYISGSNSFVLVAPAGGQRAILGATGTPASSAFRWQMLLGDGTVEGGSLNAGSNFALNSFADNGSILATPFSINRATNAVMITAQGGVNAYPPTLILNRATTANGNYIQGQRAGVTRWQMELGDFNAELGNNLGSNFRIESYTDAGVQNNPPPVLIARNSGLATFGYGVNVTGNLTAANIQVSPGRLILTDASSLQMGGGMANYVLSTNGFGGLQWVPQVGGGSAVPEAPEDGTTYARNDAAWVHLTSADITDWAAQLANYYPTSNPSGYQTAAQVTAALAPYALTANVPVASTTTPLMDGTAAVGTGTTWARADHVHPTDTSRYAASNPSGYQTAAQVTAVLPPASTTLPLPSGAAAVGVGTTYARADHVHPSDTYPHENRIINGDMRIDQRNNYTTTTPLTGAFVADRWKFNAAQPSKFTSFVQSAAAAGAAIGFSRQLTLSTVAAYTPAASEVFQVYHIIEADMITDFAFGTLNAQPVTLSFWVYSTVLTGLFSGALTNGPGTRSYPFTFSIPVVATWTKIVLIIPGDTAGTWVMSGNNAGVVLHFDLGSGANFRGPAGAWASASYVGATGSVSPVATASQTTAFTGVKLEIGSVATPFNWQSLAKSLADCQRYFETSYNDGSPPGTVTAQGGSQNYEVTSAASITNRLVEVGYQQRKRAPATVTFYSPVTGASGVVRNYTGATDAAPIVNWNAQRGFGWSLTVTAAAIYNVVGQWTADAEL